MKILKFNKKKKGIYEVYLVDNTKYLLYEEIILKYELLLTKEIPDNLVSKILHDNNICHAYVKALRYLNYKARTKKEIYNYLCDYEPSIREEVVNKLTKGGYLNDEKYIEYYINDALNLTFKGYNRILKDLVNLGIDKDIICSYLDKIDNNVWQQRVVNYLKKKYDKNTRHSINYFKDKLSANLLNLGYPKSIIFAELDKLDYGDDISILIKEYDKITKKLQGKYEGKMLESKIITKLVAKGFKYSDIRKIMYNK